MATPTPSFIIISLALLLVQVLVLLPLQAHAAPLTLTKCGVDFYGDLGIGFLNELPDFIQTSTVATNRGEHAAAATPPVSNAGEQHETHAVAPNKAGSRIITFSSRQQILQVGADELESAAAIKQTLQERDAQLKSRTAELAEARKELALSTDRAKGLASKVSTLEADKKNLQDKAAGLDRKTASLEKDIASLKAETNQKIANEGVKWKQHYVKIVGEDRNRLSGEDAKLRDELIGSAKARVIQEYKGSVEYRRDVEAEIRRHKQSPEYVKEVQGKVREGAFLSLRATVNEHTARKTNLQLREWKCYQPYFVWEDELKKQGSPLALKELQPTGVPSSKNC